MKIEFVDMFCATGVLAIFVHEDRELCGRGTVVDQAMGGALEKAMAASHFTGALNSTLVIRSPAGVAADTIVLSGAGARDSFDDLAIETAAGAAYHAVKLSGATKMTLNMTDLTAEGAARAAFAVGLASYRFLKYRTTLKPDKVPAIANVEILAAEPLSANSDYKELAPILDAVRFARDLVSEPSNILYPAEFSKRVKQMEVSGLDVEILGADALEKIGFGALLAVGRGSRRESQVAIMRWNGGRAGDQPVAFIGKGVCFDSGGISIKPAENMDEMKWDMGGAATVAGVMHSLADGAQKLMQSALWVSSKICLMVRRCALAMFLGRSPVKRSRCSTLTLKDAWCLPIAFGIPSSASNPDL